MIGEGGSFLFQRKQLMKNRPFEHFRMSWMQFLPIIVGVLVSLGVCFDPFVSAFYPLRFGGIEIWSIFPYFLISSIFLFIVFSVFCADRVKKNRRWLLGLTVLATHLEILAVGPLDPLNIMTCVLLGFWLISILFWREKIFLDDPVFLLCILFFSFVLLSLTVSYERILTIQGVLSAAAQMTLVLLLLNHLKTREDIHYILHPLFYAMCFSSIIAIVQFIVWKTTGYELLIPDQMKSEPGFTSTALFRHSNALGGVIAPAFILCFYFSLSSVFKTGRRIFYFFMSLLGAAGVYLSMSRSAWLALLVALYVLMQIKAKSAYSRTLISLGSLLMVIIGFLTGVIPAVFREVASLKNSPVAWRLLSWKEGYLTFLEHPLLGIGRQAFTRYPGNMTGKDVHNTLLQVFAETGVFAGIVFLAILFLITARLILAAFQNKDGMNRVVLQGLLLSWMVLIIHAQFDMFAFLAYFWLYIAIMECAIRVLGNQQYTFSGEGGQ